MTYVELISPSLIGEFRVGPQQQDEAYPNMIEQATRIKQISNRKFDDILDDCLNGVMVELGIVNALVRAGFSADLNKNEFNKNDPNTFAWDVQTTMLHGDDFTDRFIECKSLTSTTDLDKFYFNYNAFGARGLDLTTYIKWGTGDFGVTDFLVLAAFRADGSDYIITPKYVFDSAWFRRYVTPTPPNEGRLSHYVDIIKMIENGHCVKIQ